MRDRTYYRWLFSYMPVLFILVSGLILVSVLGMNEISRKQTKEANDIYALHVLNTVDTFLRMTEQIVVKEILTEQSIADFFRGTGEGSVLVEYKASQRINDLIVTMPYIDSIYLYRYADRIVLTEEAAFPIEQFADREFLLEASASGAGGNAWSDQRESQGLQADTVETVVSLVHSVPLLEGNRGLFVVNIAADSMERIYKEYASNGVSEVELVDSRGTMFFDPHAELDERYPNPAFLSKQVSAYSGWTMYSGISRQELLSFSPFFSFHWVWLAALIVAAGVAGLAWVTRGHYRPIQAISKRVRGYVEQTGQTLGWKDRNEWNNLEAALDRMIERSHQFETLHKEDLNLRQRHFFRAALSGESDGGAFDWDEEMQRLKLPYRFGLARVVLCEIDGHDRFTRRFSARDQYLLKFAMTNVIGEQGVTKGIEVWTEWLAGDRLGIVYFASEHASLSEAASIARCEEVRRWIERHLKFTVTFGLGDIAESPAELPASFEQSKTALQYKSTLGMNRTIHRRDIPEHSEHRLLDHLTQVRTIAERYRLGDGGWAEEYGRWSASLREASLSRDDIVNLFHYLLYQLYKEIGGLPPEFQQSWRREAVRRLSESLDRFELLDTLSAEWESLLRSQWESLMQSREERKNHRLVQDAREYIEQHYADPNLSLLHIGERYRMNVKSLSRLFKEEFGENFIDYVTRVRMSRAADWLENSDEPVQEIAMKVGYLQSNSFIRVFKKHTGMTPGDYRRQARREADRDG